MGTELITKSEFARRAGVNPSTVTKVCKTRLKAAWDGKRVDAAHPAALEYLRTKSQHATAPAATGLDPLYELVVAHCTETGVWSGAAIQREFKIGYDRSARILKNIKLNGLIPEKESAVTDLNGTPVPTAWLPPQQPKLRGNAAANHNKKQLALAEANARQKADVNAGMLHEVPADIEAFADMTLRELVERFGTDTAFLDWLKATKSIEDINEKRLKNAQTKGDLISRKLVKDHVIDTFNSAHLRMMKDGSKSIAAGVVSKSAGGADLPEIEAYVTDILGSFIKPIKNKIARVLKNA